MAKPIFENRAESVLAAGLSNRSLTPRQGDWVTRRELLTGGAAWLLAASTPLSACIPNGMLKRPLELQPRSLDDGWSIAAPESVGLDPARVRATYQRVFSPNEFINAQSLLIVRRGQLVAEGYIQRATDIGQRYHVQSITKSLTSLAFGVLQGAGVFPNLDAKLSEFLRVDDPKKQAITLRHLLTMRAGIAIDTQDFTTELFMPKRRGMTEWLLTQPQRFAPGEQFFYCDCDPQLVAAVILAATGESIESVIRRSVFAPLGISDVHWEHNGDGEPLAAQGVWLRARDLAKIGLLLLQRGQWSGAQLVPKEWVTLASRTQSDAGSEQGALGYAYGFYFWIVPELAGFSTWGHGGNFTLVVPQTELVMTLTSMPEAGADIGSELVDMVSLAHTLLG